MSRGAAWQRRQAEEFGEGGPQSWGALGVFLRTYLREVGDLRGLTTWASTSRHAWYRVKAQNIKVANIIIIFLLERSDYKNKTCFL